MKTKILADFQICISVPLMQSSHSFSIRMLILSCPSTLFGSSNLVMLQIATAVKFILDKRCSVRKLPQEGNKLLVSIRDTDHLKKNWRVRTFI